MSLRFGNDWPSQTGAESRQDKAIKVLKMLKVLIGLEGSKMRNLHSLGHARKKPRCLRRLCFARSSHGARPGAMPLS